MSFQNQYADLESAVNNLFSDNEIALSEEKISTIATKLEGDEENIYPSFSEYSEENSDDEVKFRNFGLISFDFNENNLSEYFSEISKGFFKKKEQKVKRGPIEPYDNIIIFKIFDTVEEDANFGKQDENSLRRMLKEVLLRKNNEVTLPQIILKRYIITKKIKEPEFINISVKDRVRSLEKKVDLEKNEKKDTHLIMNGYVFVAKLSDIVRGLYGKLGPRLFENNLRFSVDEQLKVESSIQDTLRNHPEYFWFYNNGISLYVPQERQLLQRKSDEISVELSEENLVSIINGAQTVSTSSKEIFNNDDDEESDDAYVLLRIFSFGTDTRMWDSFQRAKGDPTEWEKFVQTNVENVDDVKWNDLKRPEGLTSVEGTVKTTEGQNKANQMLNEITVALNRQKPIKPEDIAYTTRFVTTFNNNSHILDSGFDFNFVRRGETDSLLDHSYQLLSFARIAKAIVAQDPGKARTSGGATLLKINVKALEQDPTPMFEDSSIFISEVALDQINDEGEGELEVKKDLEKSYNAINFSFKLIDFLYKNLHKDNEKIGFRTLSGEFVDDIISNIYLYGIYHVLVLTIFQLNNERNVNEVDYTDWRLTHFDDQLDCGEGVISQSELNKTIQKSIELIYKAITEEDEPKYDSNDFKKSEQYNAAKCNILTQKKYISINFKVIDYPQYNLWKNSPATVDTWYDSPEDYDK